MTGRNYPVVEEPIDDEIGLSSRAILYRLHSIVYNVVLYHGTEISSSMNRLNSVKMTVMTPAT